eukprot:gnl/MRDRNA2_/MRDRNA2_127979_c0_seq1.p1 gnl/MRDRNA2_/MRDRNA2_127979_c0~~gnl/MRDRNA2_/MRDRNA2_127979_c0_seq1.p1  ORF type:complete len:419 (+),score=104.83 gnl/MRDRNA2_/MRDRNA2_127979_c0_seq1:57-1313(+)
MGTTGSSSAADDTVEIVVRLESHSISCGQDEVVYGMVTNHSSVAEHSLTIDRPARVVANLGSMISIRFFLHRRGNSSAQDQPVGQISIPIRCLIERCGMSLYHTRFLLTRCSPYEELHPSELVESFDRCIDDVGQKSLDPMVCLTLYNSEDDPENWASDRIKRAESYPSVLLSTMQHMQLVQALRERARANGEDASGSVEEKIEKKKEQIKMLKDQSVEQQDNIARLQAQLQNQQRGPSHALLERLKVLQQENQQLRAAAAAAQAAKPNADSTLGLVPTPEVQRLRDELVDVTSEANNRIDKANGSIQTLKEKLKRLRDVDMPQHQQRKVELMRRCEELQSYKDEKTQQQQEGSAEGGEISQLRSQLQVVVDQKTALMKIVQDLYGTVADGPAQAPGPTESNLLPSPRSLVGGDLKPL